MFGFENDDDDADYFKYSIAPPCRVVQSSYTRRPLGGGGMGFGSSTSLDGGSMSPIMEEAK